MAFFAVAQHRQHQPLSAICARPGRSPRERAGRIIGWERSTRLRWTNLPAFVEQRAWQLTWRDSPPFFYRWWFQRFFFWFFSPNPGGNGLNLTISYFSNGLKPPPSCYSFYEAFQKTPRNIQVKFRTFDDISMEACWWGEKLFFLMVVLQEQKALMNNRGRFICTTEKKVSERNTYASFSWTLIWRSLSMNFRCPSPHGLHPARLGLPGGSSRV